MLSRTSALAGALALTSLGCFMGPEGRSRSLANSDTPAPARNYQSMAARESPPPAAPAPAPQVAAAAPMAAAPPPAPATETVDPLRQLYQKAAERYATFDSYIARFRRQEQVNGKDVPEEIMAFRFRKNPWSVHFKWLDGAGKGREVVYVKGQYEDKIHTLMAAGDMPFTPAGKQIALAPDSPLVLGRCRYPITNAGIGGLIERYGQALAYRDRNGNGILRYLGPQKRPEYPAPLEAVEQTIVPGTEEVMAKGGKRFWYFDPDSNLPVLIITQNPDGHQVEYYCYDRIQYPVKLDDADFDPDRLWVPAKQ
jgi:hypothetical protein